MKWTDYLSYGRWALGQSISHPKIILRDLNRVYHKRLLFRKYNQKGIDVFKEDWDNLIIVDACRYDMFQKSNTIPGELTKVESRGSHTVEFLFGNFASRDLRDTVYITANPQFYKNSDQLDCDLHAIHNVWMEEWDDGEGTVLPEDIADRTKQLYDQYQHKRIVVHFIQPHFPFVGAGKTFDKGILREGEHTDIWTKILFGEIKISVEEIWELYQNNLTVALPAVEELVEFLPGKSVVTSDHGNMVGERSNPIPLKEWGHPIGLYTEELIQVPWLECKFDSRRTISAEETRSEMAETPETAVEDRLENLGYR